MTTGIMIASIAIRSIAAAILAATTTTTTTTTTSTSSRPPTNYVCLNCPYKCGGGGVSRQ